jgi:hypothetical protein
MKSIDIIYMIDNTLGSSVENPVREIYFCAQELRSRSESARLWYIFFTPTNSARKKRVNRTAITISNAPEQSRKGSAYTSVRFSLQQPRIDFQD